MMERFSPVAFEIQTESCLANCSTDHGTCVRQAELSISLTLTVKSSDNFLAYKGAVVDELHSVAKNQNKTVIYFLSCSLYRGV